MKARESSGNLLEESIGLTAASPPDLGLYPGDVMAWYQAWPAPSDASHDMG